MTGDRAVVVSEAQWVEAQAGVRRLKYATMALAAVVLPAMSLPALLLTRLSASGSTSYALVGGWAFVLLLRSST